MDFRRSRCPGRGPLPAAVARSFLPVAALAAAAVLVLGVLAALVYSPAAARAETAADTLAAGVAGSAGAAPASAQKPAPTGFVDPVPLIPEIGLWVDGSARIGFAKKSGLMLWWDLEAPAIGSGTAGGAPRFDWRRVTFRIRAEAFRDDGKRMADDEALVEPQHSDGASERGGFPTPLDLVLAPGEYRIHLEGYPLIAARSAGLDSVPRGVADVEVTVPEMNVGSHGWRLSDVLFLDALRKWEPGAAPERTWSDRVIHPSASRVFAADTLTAYLAFEVLRSAEAVPRCGPGRCRVLITMRDAQDGVVQQEVRPVPEAGSVQPYVIAFRPVDLTPGSYTVEVEVFEAAELQVSVRRRFRIVAPER